MEGHLRKPWRELNELWNCLALAMVLSIPVSAFVDGGQTRLALAFGVLQGALLGIAGTVAFFKSRTG